MRSFNFGSIFFAAGLYLGYFLSNNQSAVLSDNTIQTCFTPGQNCTQFIISAIEKAQNTIHVQAYGFTSLPIANALKKASDRGVKVFVLLDKSNYQNENPATALLRSGENITVKIDFVPGIAHNKVMIIDNNTLITGSFNFTNAAQKRNAENVLKLHNNNIAQTYLDNWHSRDKKLAKQN